MARPIAPTPTLKGEDAKKFLKAAENPETFSPPHVDAENLAQVVYQTLSKDGQKRS
ncbi:MAG: hypothetical protein LBJ14_02235 [Desulfarculales bacterium]|jgi:hypothetical protein|nr:hypothetical protein [Desulfarculales bacterium]